MNTDEIVHELRELGRKYISQARHPMRQAPQSRVEREILSGLATTLYDLASRAAPQYRLWLAYRTDEADYDEYERVLVRAKTASDARRFVLESKDAEYPSIPRYPGFAEHNIGVREIDGDHGEPGEVMAAMKAG